MTTPIPASDPCELTAVEAAAAIAGGHLTPSFLLEALLARTQQHDGSVHAWCWLDAESVRRDARALTEELAAGAPRGALHGVPVGVKDVFHVRGMPTRADSNATDASPLAFDATVVARLRAAGALLMGKLHTAEFALADAPPTRNPWNLEHTPGGSSSGSGAAVAARMVPAALGTQTVGSTLRPAAYCGVAGLKPTYGRLSRHGLYPLSYSLDHPGIIARSVADLALLFAVMAGPDPLDGTTLPGEPPTSGNLEVLAGPPRIGLVRDFFMDRAQPDMRRVVEDAASRLAASGAEVHDVKLPPEFAFAAPAQRLIMQIEGATAHSRRFADRAEQYGPRLRSTVEVGSLVPASFYLKAQQIRRLLSGRFLDLFEAVDVLLMPATPDQAPHGIESTGDASFLGPWSFVGYPAVSIAGGLSSDGLPMGLQFVAPPLQEARLLGVSAWCERVLGRLPAPSAVWRSSSPAPS